MLAQGVILRKIAPMIFKRLKISDKEKMLGLAGSIFFCFLSRTIFQSNAAYCDAVYEIVLCRFR